MSASTPTRAAPAPANAPMSLKSVGAFLLVSLIWGSTWLVIRDQISTVPAGWAVTWRFTLATLGMFVLCAVTRAPFTLDRRGLALALFIGLTQFVSNFQFVYRAEGYITSGLVAVLFALLILPNALLARAVLKQPITRGFLLGSAVAVAGIALLVLHELRATSLGAGAVVAGVGLTLVAILSASTANIAQAVPAIARFPIVTMLAWAMLLGTVVNAGLALALVGPPVIDMRAGWLGGVAYLALIGSVVTFPIYFGLIRAIGPGRAAYAGVLTPVVAMFLSTLFEGYRWSPLAVAGGGLALAGLVIALQARKPAR